MTCDNTGGAVRAFSKALVAALGGMVISAAFASPASAGCVDLPARSGSERITHAAYQPARITLIAADDRPTIVGLWEFKFLSKGNNVAPFFIPDGALLDQGFAEWHSDGTEMTNSSRDPATGSFCMGVWDADGPHSYKLNHFALTWDNTGQLCTPAAGAHSCFVGPANIRLKVTVDQRGTAYDGTVTITQSDADNHELFRLTGTVSASRITANERMRRRHAGHRAAFQPPPLFFVQ